MESQYCCCIEHRLGSIIIGFVVIIESFFALPVHRDWDTVINVIFGVSSGVAVLIGIYKSHKECILLYLGIEIVHISVLFISGVSVFVKSSKLLDVTVFRNDANESQLMFLGFLYLICCVINGYFWVRIYELYKIFDEYATLPYLVDVQNIKK